MKSDTPLVQRLRIERDEWKRKHDRILNEFQHRLMNLAISAVNATAYPEKLATNDNNSETLTEGVEP